MAEQPRFKPHQPTAFFDDHNTARPLVEGTVSRDAGPSDSYNYIGAIHSTTAAGVNANAALLATLNFPKDFPTSGDALRRRLERGRERFNIYCAVCHGQTGEGDGMIVQRGFTQPPAFYPVAAHATQRPDLYVREQNLLTVPPGYVYEKITNGYGAMYSYAARVSPEDRWNIAAYIRVLQSSQRHPLVAASTTQPTTRPQ